MKILVSTAIMLSFFSSCIAFAQTGVGQKIAIIDSGIYSDALLKSSRVVDELCWSRPDQASQDTGSRPGVNDLEIGSLCKNGDQSDFQSSNAATLPRITRHSSLSNEYANHTYGTAHGTRVYEEALSFAPDSRFIIVANGYYDASNRITFNGVDDTPCGVHGPNGNVDDDGSVKPSNDSRCYNPEESFRQIEVINQIRNSGNVAAINFSAGSISNNLIATNCSLNSSIFQDLKSDNIAFVAAAGNRGASAPVEYPACNRDVIAVGALKADGTIYNNTSRGIGQIDFFASGQSSGSVSISTSFAAPRVSAAFALIQSAEAKVRTVEEIKFALTESATNSVVVGGRNIPVVTIASAKAAAACLIDGTCTDTTPDGLNELDYADTDGFGDLFDNDEIKYDLQFDYRLISPPVTPVPQNTFFNSSDLDAPTTAFARLGDVVPSERDIILRFEGRAASNRANRIDVLINGVRRFSTPNFLNARNAEFIIPRTMFNAGANTITLQPRSANRPWGVTNITADFMPIVPLVLNLPDRNTYGSNQNPRRPTGMRASFELAGIDNDIMVAATGEDVDERDEIEVYVNGRFQGHLDNGSRSASLAEPNFFTVAQAGLREGLNVIEFVQKDGAVGGWKVTDILVAGDAGKPTLQLGQLDPTRYGNDFGTNENALQLEVDFSSRSQSDHKISWKAFDIERAGDLEILLNGTFLKNARTTGNNRFGAVETVTVASRLFTSGLNTLTFRSKVNAFDARWGITDLLVNTSKVINLENPSSLNKTYGYYPLYTGGIPAGWVRDYSQEEYQTRLNAQFNNTRNEDRTLTVVGWDIDSPEEVAVYLNGDFLQYLNSAALSSIFSSPNKITLPKDSLSQGINTVSLRTKDNVFAGFQSEKWGAKFTRFSSSSGAATVTPAIMLLLDE